MVLGLLEKFYKTGQQHKSIHCCLQECVQLYKVYQICKSIEQTDTVEERVQLQYELQQQKETEQKYNM